MTLLADQDRFLALLDEHKRILYKVASAYCKNRDDRLDLIQEMVIQLWRSFARFDNQRRFSTWMYRIAMNVAISFYRREGRRIRNALSIEELGLEIAAADQALEEASEEIRLLHGLINRLDALNRALVLLYLEGCSHEEIAEIVGISVSNVGTRISRIKQRLQRDFAAQQGDLQESKP